MVSYELDEGDVLEVAQLCVMQEVRPTKINIEDGHHKKRPPRSCLPRRTLTEPSREKKTVQISEPEKPPRPVSPLRLPAPGLQNRHDLMRQLYASMQRMSQNEDFLDSVRDEPGFLALQKSSLSFYNSVREDALVKANVKDGHVNEVLRLRIMAQTWRKVHDHILDLEIAAPSEQRLVRVADHIELLFYPVLREHADLVKHGSLVEEVVGIAARLRGSLEEFRGHRHTFYEPMRYPQHNRDCRLELFNSDVIRVVHRAGADHDDGSRDVMAFVVMGALMRVVPDENSSHTDKVCEMPAVVVSYRPGKGEDVKTTVSVSREDFDVCLTACFQAWSMGIIR